MYNMTNIRIEGEETYWKVIADTKRFGKNEIMFEGTFDNCFDYVKREKFGEGNEKFRCTITGQMTVYNHLVLWENDWIILHKNGFIERDWSKFGF